MSLPTSPIVKKFFTNKIESSQDEWGDYLLEIADIFSMFDGEELDRDLLTDRFSTISGRSPYVLRDVSNFRDEFGSYGTYLGVFHYKKQNGKWYIFLSKATKHFLCSTEPDVEAYCRAQLSLFQYPNGAGGSPNRNGQSVQSNVLEDTKREITNHIRINPLRLLCRTAIVMHERLGISLEQIIIPYKTIYMLFNDSSINQDFSPSYDSIELALTSYKTLKAPNWADETNFTNFKRNFHIMEKTGIFSRVSHEGLCLSPTNLTKAYNYAKAISAMNVNFNAFEACYNEDGNTINEAMIKEVIKSSKWGEYYDALTLPMNILEKLSDNIASIDNYYIFNPIGEVSIPEQNFPELKEYKSNQIRSFSHSDNITDPFETLVRREKANREHARILNLLAANICANGFEAYENTFIDLFARVADQPYIFEIKSNDDKNVLSQIRKAVSQVYEYRYRSKELNSILCIVLQKKPPQEWVLDYLVNDRKIMICWLVDDVRLECPNECFDALSKVGIVK